MAGTIPAVSHDGAFTVTDDNSNSATLLYHQADHAMDNFHPDGKAHEAFQSGGAVVGIRETDREFPTFSVTAIMASSLSAFDEMIAGTTSGFTSVTDDIGDGVAVDCSWTFNYGGESRAVSMEDCVFTKGQSAGSPMIATYNCTVYGIVKARDVDGNWTTLIAAR